MIVGGLPVAIQGGLNNGTRSGGWMDFNGERSGSAVL